MPAWSQGIRSGTRAESTALTLVSEHAGTLFYVTDEDVLERWSGSAWVQVATNASPAVELDYVERTVAFAMTSNAEATPDTILTGAATVFDGNPVMAEVYFAYAAPVNAAGARFTYLLWDNTAGAQVCRLGTGPTASSTSTPYAPVYMSRRFTPAAGTRTYSFRAYVSVGAIGGTIGCGTGLAGAYAPGFMRLSRVV